MAEHPRAWLAALMAETLGCDAAAITDEALLTDLGADSLDALEIVMVAEDHFHIKIADDEATGCETFGQLVALVERRQPDGRHPSTTRRSPDPNVGREHVCPRDLSSAI